MRLLFAARRDSADRRCRRVESCKERYPTCDGSLKKSEFNDRISNFSGNYDLPRIAAFTSRPGKAASLKALAIAIGLGAAGCIGTALWLLALALRLYFSDAYAPGAGTSFYTAGGIDADGAGIFAPAVLLLAVGLFLAKFAFNLWRPARRKPE